MNNEQIFTPLIVYLKTRSKEEGVPFELDVLWFLNHYQMGIRNFFGVEIDDDGNLLSDDNEPYDGYLQGFLNYLNGIKDVEEEYHQFLEINKLLRDNEIETITSDN